MTCVFFTWLKVMEGHPELILATIQAKVLPTLAANYLFWPLVHMFNFRYVPTEWRVLYNQVMCIAWIGFLSVLTHHGITISDVSF
jgi:protein Mpv17